MPVPTEMEHDRRWSWIQFAVAFGVGGGVAFLDVSQPFDGLAAHMVKTLLIAAVCGCAAGRFGDSAWERGVTLLRRLLFWM
jgi:hypothetical protein